MTFRSSTPMLARTIAAVALLLAVIPAPAALAKESASKPLTRKQVIALIKEYSKPGANGTPGANGAPGAPAPTYSAGTGVLLTNNVFSFDPSTVQSRIGGCGSSAEVIFGIAQSGSPTCDYGAEIESAQEGSNKSIGGNTLLATVAVTPGSSFLTADTTLENSSGSPVLAECFIYDHSSAVIAETDTLVPAKFSGTNGAASVAVQGFQHNVASQADTFNCGAATNGVISTESGLTTNLTTLSVGSASVFIAG